MVTHQLTLSQAIANFMHDKEAVGGGEHTIADYHSTRKKLLEFFANDPPFASITRTQLISFFAWLTREYVSDPYGVAPRGKKQLSPKTIFNTPIAHRYGPGRAMKRSSSATYCAQSSHPLMNHA